jgi:hypothetical protein
MKTDKTFYRKYHPEYNQILKEGKEESEFENMAPLGGCLYETYGEEVDHVLNEGQKNGFKNVWTVIHSDGRSSAWYVVAGWHFVNRIGYLITKEEWQDGNEEYKF